uniref:Heterogeneous nuclear ribonucleoprotein L n=1 Tax=Schizaphis graminum TaxID=13262 RepID=A0A2S2PKX2_SCHGA
MEDVEAARRCVSNLHMLQLDDDVFMKVKYSKHNFIHDQVNFNILADGTPVQKVYLSSTLNRFVPNVSCPDKRRIAAPSKILHFFNAPTDVCGKAVHRSVSDALCRTDAIRSITILPKKPKAKCSTGLIELKNMALAARTVILANHMTIESTVSRFPFLTKLCFSKWSEIEQKSGDPTTLQFCSVPRTPWLLHKSEHGVPTTEFPISCTTMVDGCGGGDCMWTLWVVTATQKNWQQPQQTSQAAEESAEESAVSAAEESAVSTTDAATDCDPLCTFDPIIRRNLMAAENADLVFDLIDMLRNRLCDFSNDRGDVLCGPAAVTPARVEHDDASTSASTITASTSDAAIQSGPPGDA